MHRRFVLTALAIALIVPAIYSLSRRDGAKEHSRVNVQTLVSDPYHLDKIYRSMEGPMSVASSVHLPASTCPVQWITGLESEVVDAADQKPISQEFFCHSNLTFAEHGRTPAQYNQRFHGKTHFDWRLFTLVPGRLAIELPPGFGIPLPADASLDYLTMSLNLNVKDAVTNVRMRTKVHTISADQPGAPTKALFRRALYVTRPASEAVAMSSANMDGQHVGAGCADFCQRDLQQVSNNVAPADNQTNHWTVPPGRHVYTTEITPQLNLPFDTTVHYATIHVHPYAKMMELRDLTTGQVIFRLNCRDWPDRVGVAYVDEFKSIDGVPISRGHRYSLTAEYDNTSGAPTDAMAILYLYLLEKDLT
ncbi:MAG: hypothetical protein M3R59_08830 [Verrucomicrobiota bacterium]|nr:hypothetical protein [Verrucomicrobiota bacterium]